MAAGLARLSAKISGRVQGVCFRAFVSTNATALGLVGFAQNMDDGSVRVEAEGQRAALENLVIALHCGPGHARVDQVETSWREATGEFSGFSIL